MDEGPQKSHRGQGSDSSGPKTGTVRWREAVVPATVAAISDGVRWAVEIMREIDEKFPAKSGLQKTTLG